MGVCFGCSLDKTTVPKKKRWRIYELINGLTMNTAMSSYMVEILTSEALIPCTWNKRSILYGVIAPEMEGNPLIRTLIYMAATYVHVSRVVFCFKLHSPGVWDFCYNVYCCLSLQN